MTTLSTRLGSELRFRFSSAAFAADKFDVVNLEGFEAINRPYRFALMLVSDDAEIDFDKILKNSGTLCIYSPDGTQEVPYHGVIAEFEQLHTKKVNKIPLKFLKNAKTMKFHRFSLIFH